SNDPTSAPSEDVDMTSGDPPLTHSGDSEMDTWSVPDPDDNLSTFQKLERELAAADKDKQNALARYMETKVAVRKLKQMDSQDSSLTDAQRRRNALKHDSKVEDAQRELVTAERDFNTAHHHWILMRPQPVEVQYREEQQSML
ncbi:hypothetical protein EC968_010246, partial [Mortierella alpina]